MARPIRIEYPGAFYHVTCRGNEDQKTTTYTYDDRDNLLTLTDGENNTTTFEYDRNNRLTKETRPMRKEGVSR